ncbi:LOW QUALITY PROTEIN: huntingtin-associated protein 1 [Ascaphus truei]|uniref:LOW QUALITY PROTEIN: huntingtin-associated protein 1 n=1 Tax=Ascaphus truei TaxID=8439 RepID=UPI003F59ABC2
MEWNACRGNKTVIRDELPLCLEKNVFGQCILPMLTYGWKTWNLSERLGQGSGGEGGGGVWQRSRCSRSSPVCARPAAEHRAACSASHPPRSPLTAEPTRRRTRGITVSLAEGHPAPISSVHGSLLLPLTPAKLDPSVPHAEAPSASILQAYPADHHPPACLPTAQGNATPRTSSVGKDANRRDASTITEVCSGADVPEVEIISLLQDQLPRYALRADAAFGYEHDDWLRTPLLPPDLPFNLTPLQIEETLKYFLLCSERLGRVTKTYRDIDALTSLLEEKEKDLELAARIGQSLLKQNRALSERNGFLEEQVENATEEVSQLRHEVSMREDLLHLYTSSTESEPVSTTSVPLRRNKSSFCLQHGQLDTLQQKLSSLEEENQKLRSEADHLLTETIQYEDREGALMLDCVEQFSEASRQVGLLAEELARRGRDTARQQEEISQLLAQIVRLQQKCRSCSTENEELQQNLSAAKELQQQLKRELQDVREKSAEYQDMLQEVQEEVKELRNKSLPNSSISRYSTLNIFPLDSLAAEIEGTMRKGMDFTASSELKSYKRVFETVKAANQVVRARSRCPSPQNIPGSRAPSRRPSSTPSGVGTPPFGHYESENASMVMLEERTLIPEPEVESAVAAEKMLGTPGTPGSHDLSAALQRLSAQRASHSPDRLSEERASKLPRDGDGSSGFLTPRRSVLSTGTNYSGVSEVSDSSSLSFGSRSYLPEKLQIVKPLEGSATLLHWQQLAKPNMGGILDPRPGVLTKDFQELEIDQEDVYNHNDFEEDDVDMTSFKLWPPPHRPNAGRSTTSLSYGSSLLRELREPELSQPGAPKATAGVPGPTWRRPAQLRTRHSHGTSHLVEGTRYLRQHRPPRQKPPRRAR